MLGYVRAYKPELKCREYDVYKGVYCSLCKTLLRRYSPLGQLFLSYDVSFFALTLLALSPQCPAMHRSRCCYNPAKRCLRCDPSADMDFCADVSVLLYYYQILDHLQDKGFWKKVLSALLFPAAWCLYRIAALRQKQADEIIRKMMRAQRKTERDASCGVDATADPSASALGALAGLRVENEQFVHLFYLLGRFVYLIDAADDVRKDMRSGSFNPLKSVYAFSPDVFADRAMEMLNATIAEMLECFDRLEWQQHGEIVHNVLFDGLYNSAVYVTRQYRTKQEAES